MGETKRYQFERRLYGNAGAVWATLAAVGGVQEWFPLIKTCRVEGDGAGARRYCVTADGSALEERITALDSEARRLSYTVERGLPVERYAGVFEVRRDADGGHSLVWHIEAAGSAEAIGQIDALLGQAVPMAFDGLERSGRPA